VSHLPNSTGDGINDVSRGALRDLATKVGFSGSDADIFETYRNLIEQAASDVYDADGPTDEHGRFLVIEAALRQ
jgi:hypothetical protein